MMHEYILVFLIGACVGSFLNVCIYRLPRDMSIVKPRSFCPGCKTRLPWYDNIPVLSFLALRGKCRSCKQPISVRYPLVELLTAVLCLFLYMRFGLSAGFFKFSLFFCLLIAVSFIDIDYHAIPGYMCFLGILVALTFGIFDTIAALKAGYPGELPVITVFKGLVFGLGFTYLFKFFGDILLGMYLALIKKKSIEGETESLGLGDVDFMGMVGAFLGIMPVVTTFFLAPFIAVLYSVFALIFKRSHLIPYLPYLSVATFISFLWGRQILGFFGI